MPQENEEKPMPVDVLMPQMGESIFEGTITKWLKKPGDRIERDEPLFEISTDKVDAEIPAPSAGVLKEIKVSEGQTVPIQTVVAVIDAVGASAGAPPRVPSPAPAPPPACQKPPKPHAAPAPAAAPPLAVPSAVAVGAASVPAGPGGALVHPGLENAVPRERIYFGNYSAQPMTAMRQRIAEHMVASKRVSPHVYSIDEA